MLQLWTIKMEHNFQLRLIIFFKITECAKHVNIAAFFVILKSLFIISPMTLFIEIEKKNSKICMKSQKTLNFQCNPVKKELEASYVQILKYISKL